MKRLIRKAVVLPDGIWVQPQIAKTMKNFGLDPWLKIKRFIDVENGKQILEKNIARMEELNAPTRLIEEKKEYLKNFLEKGYVEDELHIILESMMNSSDPNLGFIFTDDYNFNEGQINRVLNNWDIDPKQHDNIQRFITKWGENMLLQKRLDESDMFDDFDMMKDISTTRPDDPEEHKKWQK